MGLGGVEYVVSVVLFEAESDGDNVDRIMWRKRLKEAYITYDSVHKQNEPENIE